MPCNKKTKELLFTETSSPFLFSLILLLCSFDNLLQRFCDRCFQLRLICRCLDSQLTDQCCYVIVSNLTKARNGRDFYVHIVYFQKRSQNINRTIISRSCTGFCKRYLRCLVRIQILFS